ncbi:MAG: NUDIX domain-containing protein [Pirellulaceae bacterium]
MTNVTVDAAGMLLLTRTAPVQFLLMQHSNRWDLPKGHAEPGESILETALRETEEETGISADEIHVDPSFKFAIEYYVTGKKRGDYHKRVTYFLGTVEAPREVELTEHVGFRWFDWPPAGPIQTQTIDPLLAAVGQHLASTT